MSELVDAMRAGDTSLLRHAIRKDPKTALEPGLVIDAARVANEEALVLLLDAGADPNAKKRGYRPLHALIQERIHGEVEAPSPQRLKCLDILLARSADPEYLGAFPPARALVIAAFTGERGLTDPIVAARAVQNIFTASAMLEEKAVKRALTADKTLSRARDGDVLTALHCCAGSKMQQGDAKLARAKLSIARNLLDAGADPNALAKAWSDEVDVAYFAARQGDLATFDLLLDSGADATNALPSAVWGSHFTLAESALAHGADVDRATSNGKPLLNDLIRWGQVEPALWALAQGASTSMCDSEGWTALHQAVSRGNARLVQALIDAGADPDAADLQGRTPAGLSRAANRAKIRPLLLSARARSAGREPYKASSTTKTKRHPKTRSTKKAKS